MKKKLVVVLMAAVMAMTAVTGCGSKADDAKNDTQASKASESETSANADQEAAMHVADLIDAIYVQERTNYCFGGPACGPNLQKHYLCKR